MDAETRVEKPSDPGAAVLPASWLEVLHQVEQALHQAVAEAAERERTVASARSAATTPEGEPVWQDGLQRLEERLQGLHAVVSQAEQRVAEVDGALAAAEAGLREGLTAAGASGQRLADGTGRGMMTPAPE
jgi:hypothetical protein